MKRLSRTELTSRLGIGSREAELGRVMQDEESPGGGLGTCLCRREVSGKDDRFDDARIAEESVSGLGGGPVLAGQRVVALMRSPRSVRSLLNRLFNRWSGNWAASSSPSTQSFISMTSNDLGASNFDQTLRQQESRNPEKDTPDLSGICKVGLTLRYARRSPHR